MARFKVRGKRNDDGWGFHICIGGLESESGGRGPELLQLIYSVGGLLLGLACIVGGVILFIAGVAGQTNWKADFKFAKTELTEAAPGVILFVVGLFIVWVTRFKLFKREWIKSPTDTQVKEPKRVQDAEPGAAADGGA